MPITSFSGDQTAPNTPCVAAVDGAKVLPSLGSILDWDAAWECLGLGTRAEGGYKTTPKPRQSSGGMNNKHTHTRVQTAFSLMEDCRNITFPWGSAVK